MCALYLLSLCFDSIRLQPPRTTLYPINFVLKIQIKNGDKKKEHP